jgi:hypothetical protein
VKKNFRLRECCVNTLLEAPACLACLACLRQANKYYSPHPIHFSAPL